MLTAGQAKRILGARTAELRRELELTQEQLAERLQWLPRQVQRVEAGQSNLSLSRLVVLANALGVDLPSLLSPPARKAQRRPGRPSAKRV